MLLFLFIVFTNSLIFKFILLGSFHEKYLDNFSIFIFSKLSTSTQEDLNNSLFFIFSLI